MDQDSSDEKNIGIWEKTKRALMTLNISSYSKKVRMQMYIMIGFTGLLCLVSLYVFYYN